MAFDGDSPAATVGVDLTLDRMDILDRGKIQVFAPDEGFELAQKALPSGPVAGDRTGLDQCRAFPILANALIIGQRCRDGERRWGGSRIRAEPEIGAKDVAVGCPLVENATETPCQPNEKRLGAVPSSHLSSGRVVEKDQIDI